MGKLIKYEFRKQLMSKLVVGAVVAVLELVFFAGIIFDKGYWAGMGLGLFALVSMIALLYFSFESIVTYSNDLKTKHSYMLFLTPCNMFQIVGAKLVTTILQIFVCGCAFLAIAIGDIFLLCAERMGVKPEDCVVFEDAEPGIQAALAAGMDYVRVGECAPVRD